MREIRIFKDPSDSEVNHTIDNMTGDGYTLSSTESLVTQESLYIILWFDTE